MHIDNLRSHRVTGLAHLQLKNKRPVKQALPLTARQVLFLEARAARQPPTYESLVAGGLCFALFSRGRHSGALVQFPGHAVGSRPVKPSTWAGGDYLLPALGAHRCLLPAYLSSTEATRWLRAILGHDKQADQDKILQLSSRSLKATLLSWTAKVGVSGDNQTLLGYHSLGVSRSALTYSRDALCGPLRDLDRVFW